MATRREQREALRQERQQRERAAAESKRRKRLVGFGIAGVVVLASVVALGLFLAGRGGSGGPLADPNAYPDGSVPAQRVTDLDAAAEAAGCRVRSFPSEGNDHVATPVEYKSNPPHSGDHLEIPAEDQAFTETPQTEALVHSLEHGRIIIQFRPGASAELRGALKALYDEGPYHVILTPNGTQMPYAVAATAWRRTLTCDEAGPKVYDAIRAFREAYRDRGPEDVP